VDVPLGARASVLSMRFGASERVVIGLLIGFALWTWLAVRVVGVPPPGTRIWIAAAFGGSRVHDRRRVRVGLGDHGDRVRCHRWPLIADRRATR
jgi:hypothetical protein